MLFSTSSLISNCFDLTTQVILVRALYDDSMPTYQHLTEASAAICLILMVTYFTKIEYKIFT